MNVSQKVVQGQPLPRGSWRGVDPRTKVVPAKKGTKAPYRRQSRRKGNRAAWNRMDGSV